MHDLFPQQQALDAALLQEQKATYSSEVKEALIAQSKCYRTIGNIHFSDGEYSVAAENYEKRVKIAHRLKDDVAEARALGNLANAIGRLQTARGIELYKECIALAQKVHDVQVSFET
jgi:tetratricopeptide (TPR) repeat protein